MRYCFGIAEELKKVQKGLEQAGGKAFAAQRTVDGAKIEEQD